MSGQPEPVAVILATHGNEPAAEGDAGVTATCPFHALARNHTDVVCGMNLG